MSTTESGTGIIVMVKAPGEYANSQLNGIRAEILSAHPTFLKVRLLDGEREGRVWNLDPRHVVGYNGNLRAMVWAAMEMAFKVGADDADNMPVGERMERILVPWAETCLFSHDPDAAVVPHAVEQRAAYEREEPTLPHAPSPEPTGEASPGSPEPVLSRAERFASSHPDSDWVQNRALCAAVLDVLDVRTAQRVFARSMDFRGGFRAREKERAELVAPAVGPLDDDSPITITPRHALNGLGLKAVLGEVVELVATDAKNWPMVMEVVPAGFTFAPMVDTGTLGPITVPVTWPTYPNQSAGVCPLPVVVRVHTDDGRVSVWHVDETAKVVLEDPPHPDPVVRLKLWKRKGGHIHELRAELEEIAEEFSREVMQLRGERTRARLEEEDRNAEMFKRGWFAREDHDTGTLVEVLPGAYPFPGEWSEAVYNGSRMGVKFARVEQGRPECTITLRRFPDGQPCPPLTAWSSSPGWNRLRASPRTSTTEPVTITPQRPDSDTGSVRVGRPFSSDRPAQLAWQRGTAGDLTRGGE